MPFQNHPFKVQDDEKMEELVNSMLIPLLCHIISMVGLIRWDKLYEA